MNVGQREHLAGESDGVYVCVCVKQSSSLPDCWQASRYSIHLTTKGQKLGRRLTIVEECWGRGRQMCMICGFAMEDIL